MRVTVRSRNARSCETTTTEPSKPARNTSSALEPGEVEVVRRLVEEQHVVAAEEDRRERGPRRLAAGERRRAGARARHRARARRARPRPRHRSRRRRARGTRRAPWCTRRRSARLVAEPRGEPVHPRRGRARRRCGARGSRAASRPAAGRAPAAGADGERRRSRRTLPPSGCRAREQPQQRRLARAVRPDEADPRARRHDEIDARRGRGALRVTSRRR